MGMRIGSKELTRLAPGTPPPLSPLATEKFFDLSADMLCLAGLDGYFKVLNQAWSQTLGYRDEELLHVPFVEFVHPDDREATIAETAKLGRGLKTINFRNRYRCKDGRYKWLAWSATPVLDNGTIYAAARDITNEVEAEEAGRAACPGGDGGRGGRPCFPADSQHSRTAGHWVRGTLPVPHPADAAAGSVVQRRQCSRSPHAARAPRHSPCDGAGVQPA